MGKQSVDEQTITDYLLGASSDADTEILDEMSLTDSEFVERSQAVENDLVDGYLRGELPADEAARFTSHYLASPRRRDKVRFAQTLVAYAEKAATSQGQDLQVTAPESRAESEAARREPFGFMFFALPRLTPHWGLAAAALIILLGAGYLFVENLRLRNQMTQTQTERAALEQRADELKRQLDEQRSADAETERELAEVRDKLAQLEQQVAAGQQGKPEPEQRDLKVIAFNLSPQARGIGRIPTLTVPAGAEYVALTMELEAEDFPTYQAALKNPANGQIVWRSGEIKPSGKGKALRVSLRASLLNSQNYVLELSIGVAGNVGSYAFKVVKQ